MREKLLDLLVQHSYSRASYDKFELSSGRRSNFYIDCKATSMRGAAMPLIGEAVTAHLPPTTDAVGGLTLGADPIAAATAYYCQTIGRHVDFFTVRKSAKKHGLMKYIEGCPGRNVVIIDDVVTTGGSTIEAIQRCREAELQVVGVVMLVDREEGGFEAVCAAAGADVSVKSVFKRADLEARWEELKNRCQVSGAGAQGDP